MPFLSPGLPLFLQLSHCGTADWATSLCHKAFSVRASSQLAESFPSVKTPWVSACSGSLLLSSHSPSPTQSHPVYTSIVAWVGPGATTMWVRARKAARTFLCVKSTPARIVLLLSSSVISPSLWQIFVLSIRPPEAAKSVPSCFYPPERQLLVLELLALSGKRPNLTPDDCSTLSHNDTTLE